MGPQGHTESQWWVVLDVLAAWQHKNGPLFPREPGLAPLFPVQPLGLGHLPAQRDGLPLTSPRVCRGAQVFWQHLQQPAATVRTCLPPRTGTPRSKQPTWKELPFKLRGSSCWGPYTGKASCGPNSNYTDPGQDKRSPLPSQRRWGAWAYSPQGRLAFLLSTKPELFRSLL